MKKTFTLWAACALPMLSPLSADESAEELAKIQKDRERLIDLALNLEADFGKTLQGYTKLQEEYAKLLNRPAVPDQSGKVKELQKQLEAANAKLKAQPEFSNDANAQALLELDLVNLRNELHRERQELLVAKAQLIRVKQLEKKNKDLEYSLKTETANREETMGQLQAIRGERDALLGRLTKAMSRAEKAEKSHATANTRIGQLAKETNTLKLQLNKQEIELRELRVEQDHHKGAMAAAADLKKEQDRLTALLSTREKDLAAEMKRSLDVPILIKARDELQKKLNTSNANADSLKKKNTTLTEKQAQLQKEIESAQESIAAMQAAFAKNKEAMASVTKLGAENTALVDDRERLMTAIATAKTDLARAQNSLKKTETQLTESKKLSASAVDLKKQNAALLKQQELHKQTLASSRADVGAMQKSITQNQTALKKAQDETDRLQKIYDTLNASVMALEKEKATLSTEIKKRDAELKKLRVEMSGKPDMSASVAKLQEEKDKLAADLAKREKDLKKTRSDLGHLQLSAEVATKQLIALKRQSAQIDPVRYAKGAADVTSQQTRVLAQVQEALKFFPDARFEIVGHTCDLGSSDGNLRLSQQRANALSDFLLEKGIKEERLKFRGVGQAEPAAPNTSENNRRQNRRVVVEILD